ncbi:MAG: hypothetical protein M3121_05280, partial [Chloroflexota bacterium]|nr:hypothetical protein [Chloroflexota bacterium]
MAMAIGAEEEASGAQRAAKHALAGAMRWLGQAEWRRWLCRTAVAAAVLAIVLHGLSFAGLIDWATLETNLGRPWRELLNPAVGPSMALLLAAEGCAFLLVLGLGWLVSSSRLRAVGGE